MHDRVAAVFARGVHERARLDEALGTDGHRIHAAAQDVAADQRREERVVDGLSRVDGYVMGRAELLGPGRDRSQLVR